MLFEYSAKSLRGTVTDGVIEASSASAAIQLLKNQGMFVVSLREHLTKSMRAVKFRKSGRKRIHKRDLLLFTTQLSIMCRSGVNLAEAISSIADQWPPTAFRDVLQRLYKDLSEGKSVSTALHEQVGVFGEAYVAGIASGEASGRIPQVLEKLAELLRNEMRLVRSLRAALTYPIVLLAIACIVSACLLFFVLPEFAGVFRDMEIPLPLTTRWLLSFAGDLRERFWLWGGAAAFLAYLFRRYALSERGRRDRDRLMVKLPVLREVVSTLFVGRSFRMLGTMLQSGVPLLETIELVRKSVKNAFHRELLDRLREDVSVGRGIGAALTASPYVPQNAVQMAVTAEKSGDLGAVLQIVGEYFEEEGEERLRGLAKLLEPAVIVVMGVFVAFIVVSTMLPLFDFSQASH